MAIKDKHKDSLRTAISGMIVGASMMLPGVSGGTCAIMLGIYDRLISSVSGIFRHFKKSVAFLIIFCIGAGAGMLLFANLAKSLVDAFEFPMKYLFTGLIIGTLPMLFRKGVSNVSDEKKRGFGITDAVMILIGVGVAVPLMFMPQDLFVFGESLNVQSVLILLAAGAALSVALVLPGISVSSTMYLFGLYDRTLQAITELDVAFLFPLVFGVLAGTFLVTALLEKAMTRYTRQTYLIIGGFVLATVFELFPGLPNGFAIAICATTLASGFLATFFLGKKTINLE